MSKKTFKHVYLAGNGVGACECKCCVACRINLKEGKGQDYFREEVDFDT